jgi:Trehalose utilisation
VRAGWKVLAIVVGCSACGATTAARPANATADASPASRDADVRGGDASAPSVDVPAAEIATILDAVADHAATIDADVRAPEVGGPEVGVDAGPSDGPTLPARVLLYHFSTLVIDSVPAQLTFFKALLAGWGYASDDSVDPARFTDAGLAAYGAVAMINTCFSPFGDGKDGAKESAALQRFVDRGGGLFGTHCAAVTFQSTTPAPPYNQLFGGQEGNGFFDGTSSCRKLGAHPTTDGLPATFDFPGNLDNNQFLSPSSTITVRCKWGAAEMRDVAVSWVRAEGQGRVFYTNFGKVVGDLTDPVLGAKHIVPGLAWVLRR